MEDGTSIDDIDAAIRATRAGKKDKPSLIEIKTQIGYGLAPKQGTWHRPTESPLALGQPTGGQENTGLGLQRRIPCGRTK